MEIKKCILCNKTKLLIDFYERKDSKDGHRSECKVCKKEKSTLWGKNNPEKVLEATRKYQKKHIAQKLKNI